MAGIGNDGARRVCVCFRLRPTTRATGRIDRFIQLWEEAAQDARERGEFSPVTHGFVLDASTADAHMVDAMFSQIADAIPGLRVRVGAEDRAYILDRVRSTERKKLLFKIKVDVHVDADPCSKRLLFLSCNEPAPQMRVYVVTAADLITPEALLPVLSDVWPVLGLPGSPPVTYPMPQSSLERVWTRNYCHLQLQHAAPEDMQDSDVDVL
jgi:hypothetical protein